MVADMGNIKKIRVLSVFSMLFLAANAYAVPNADFNSNGVVDSNDASVLFSQFGLTTSSPDFNPLVDLNGNGVIDSNDASTMFGSFGMAVDSDGVVITNVDPGGTDVSLAEPSTLWLFALGCALVVGFSRRSTTG
jgi:hypothetical protein